MQKPSSENNLFMVSDKGTHNICMLIDSISSTFTSKCHFYNIVLGVDEL